MHVTMIASSGEMTEVRLVLIATDIASSTVIRKVENAGSDPENDKMFHLNQNTSVIEYK